MAERNESNDEYQFGESDLENETQDAPTEVEEQPVTRNFLDDPLKRKVLVVFGVIIFVYVIYHFIGSRFEKAPAKFEVPKITSAPVVKPVESPVESPVEQPIKPDLNHIDYQKRENDLDNRLSVLETEKETSGAQIDTINSQIQALTTRMDEQSEKIVALNVTLAQINDKLDTQGQQLQRMTQRAMAKKQPVKRKASTHYSVYHIQAVIPGRAWLMSNNGNSVTVREGTTLPGYGVIQLIDASQGRVMTSSGRMIRFSQEDS